MTLRSTSILLLALVLLLAQSVISFENTLDPRKGGDATTPDPDDCSVSAVEQITDLLICSPETCRGKTCPASKKRSLGNLTLGLDKRGNPVEGDWIDPTDYPSADYFIRQVVNNIYNHPVGFSSKLDEWKADVEDEQEKAALLQKWDGSTYSNYITFEDQVNSLALTGLCGCTAVAVISRRGAWVGHIWERSIKDDEKWKKFGIAKIHKGDGDENKYHRFGIDDLRNNPRMGADGLLFPSSGAPNDDLGVHVFIVTPRPRIEFIGPDLGSLSTDEEREDRNYNLDQPPMFEPRIEEIQRDMKNTFPSARIEVLTYTPRVPTNALQKEMTDAAISRDQDAFERASKRTNAYKFDDNYSSPRGKLLIQYRPASDGNDKARWRIWSEAPEPRGKAEWEPLDGQVFRSPPTQKAVKRQDRFKEKETGLRKPKTAPLKTGNNRNASDSKPEDQPLKMPWKYGHQKCKDAAKVPDHKPVSQEDVLSLAWEICRDHEFMVRPGDSSSRNKTGSLGHSDIHYDVRWIEKCETRFDAQNILNPLNFYLPSVVDRCVKLFAGNWKNCDNGGIGGYRDVGCLRYSMGVGLAPKE
ncbi:hypothetical protein FQN54_003766 [Arachnomyces sp. PD_36]|nr:hypothetical protein FQN54_003766 [Arachnomyces sp. PD_36]